MSRQNKALSRIPKLSGYGILAFIVLVVLVAHLREYASHGSYPYDLRAFYCAGKISGNGANPYTVEPLRSCEATLTGSRAAQPPLPEHVLPAPIPPYDVVILQPLGKLSPYAAKFVFLLLSLAALVLTITCVARASRNSIVVVASAITIGAFYEASALGQITTFCLAAVALAAYFVKRGSYRASAIAACCSFVQPQIGLFVVVALFCAEPKTRRTIVASCGVLLALSATMFNHGLMDYARTIAIHTRAEQNMSEQFSLSWIVFHLGASSQLSATVGSVAVAVFLVCAVVLGFATRGRPHLAIAVGATLAVLPGSFLHAQQIATALVAGFLFLPQRVWMRNLVTAGLAMLVFPWEPLAHLAWSPTVAITTIVSLAVVAAVVSYTMRMNPARLRYAGVALAVTGIAMWFFLVRVLNAAQPRLGVPAPALGGGELASSDWAIYLSSVAHQASAYDWFAKVPLWFGVVLLVGAGIGAVLSGENSDDVVAMKKAPTVPHAV